MEPSSVPRIGDTVDVSLLIVFNVTDPSTSTKRRSVVSHVRRKQGTETMKHILLLITALTLLPVHAAAQSFGLHVGAARTSISMDDEGAGIEARTGLVGGVSFDLPISDIAALRLGAAYVEKGASFKGNDGGNLSLNYIELPAMMRFGSSVYGLVGATVGINSGCSFVFWTFSET